MIKSLGYHILTELKLYLRIPMSLFWVILFPILQLVLFGAVFGGYSPIHITLGIVREDNSHSSAELLASLKQVEIMQTLEGSWDELQARMQNNQIMAILLIPQGFDKKLREKNAELILYYSPTQGPLNEVVFSVMQEIVHRANERISGRKGPIFIQKKSLTPSLEKVGYTAHLLAGLVGMVILTIAIFSIAIPIATARERGYLKRLCVSPVHKGMYMAAFVSAGVIIALVQTGILMAGGILFYQMQVLGSPIHLCVWLLLGIATFMAIGIFLAAISPTVVTANVLGFMIFFPMLFLSEVYFPITNLPHFMKEAIELFPLLHFIKVFRKIMNEGALLWSFPKEVVILLFWCVVPSMLAYRHFRWTPTR
jgi:ABC-2 type transport system permease protein